MMTWLEQEHGWVAAPEEIVKAFSKDGFEECNRQTTTSRREWQPPGGVWQGGDTRTGSVASATWVNRPPWHQPIMAGRVVAVSGDQDTTTARLGGHPRTGAVLR